MKDRNTCGPLTISTNTIVKRNISVGFGYFYGITRKGKCRPFDTEYGQILSHWLHFQVTGDILGAFGPLAA